MIAKILLKTAFPGKIHLIYVFHLKGILLLLFLNLLSPKNKTAVAVPLGVNYKKKLPRLLGRILEKLCGRRLRTPWANP